MKAVLLLMGFGLALLSIGAGYLFVESDMTLVMDKVAVAALLVGGGFFWGFGVRELQCLGERRIGRGN